ncbi:hypothetical protein [Actinomadura violacea]|uniref:RNase H type-1 domain-containing protein n=1 Tax=Actinomadura violacea TaxID=2819934 RepID=A0ABS3RZ46_9ACTN|nr:hypothetical protein [Actinomadura violacea]MBO2461733.1 hypothetical protein [Actinomadura violacea]
MTVQEIHDTRRDVVMMGSVEFTSDKLDHDDAGLLTVAGVPSWQMPYGAFGTVDGDGHAVGGWFVRPYGPTNYAQSYCVLQALRRGLRDYPDGAKVKVVMDSPDAAAMLTAPVQDAQRTKLYREFPNGAQDVFEHRRRMTLTHQPDVPAEGVRHQRGDVGHHPLMVAAHRLAYALLRFAETGAYLRVTDEDWLADIIEHPSNKQRTVKRAVDQWLEERCTR